jgi:D-sedoheptulose 7-phosphate isomerase
MGEADAAARVRGVLDAAVAAHQRARGVEAAVVGAAGMIRSALADGNKLMVFGNGGSASDAQHMAAELVGRFQRDRPGLAAVALTTDTSTLTSVANDYGFERVFARQIEALGRPGDVALGISTSGASANVVAALVAAREAGIVTIALTGRDGGAAGETAEIHVNVPEQSTARIQEVHRTLIHAICELVEGEQ